MYLHEFIFDVLRNHREYRDWDYILETMNPKPVKYFRDEPVYSFFMSMDESLEFSAQPIALTVNPIDSFVPFHYHDHVEIIIVLLGTATILTEHEKVVLSSGDIFIVGPNTVHQNLSISQKDIVLNIALRPTAFSNNDLDFLRRSGTSKYLSDLLFFTPNDNYEHGIYTVFRHKEGDGIEGTVANIVYEYFVKQDDLSNSVIRFELLILFVKLLRISHRDFDVVVNNQKAENVLLSILLYIEKHYATLTLEELGEKFGFNPNYLSTFLKKNTGKSFIKLLHIQRVNVAAEYLMYSNAAIEKIAIKVGYENPSYFYKIFKNILGMSPANYRQKAQNISWNC